MSALVHTPLDEIEKIHATLKAGFATRRSRPVAYRRTQLAQLAHLLNDNRDAIAAALKLDLGRPSFETDMLETSSTLTEVVGAYNNVASWAKTEALPFTMKDGATRPAIRKEPKGVVLIIGPFNFPLFCTIGPFAGAIAAGNACVLKFSEVSPASAALFTELFPKYMDQEMYTCVNGAIPEATKLLELKWDHILYTGSDRVGKIVAMAAAKHLTPVTLELGGKSPVFIDPKCNIMKAARKIVGGRVSNAGQTCVAPDYILVPRESQDALVAALEAAVRECYPSGARTSPDFARIVNDVNFKRVHDLLQRTEGKVVLGGATECDEAERYVPPTIVRDVSVHDALMSQELFAPILPVVPVDDVDEAIKIVNAGEHPLSLYVFSQDAAYKAKVFDNTQSGGCVANEVIIHLGIEGLPFGGVGSSGYGAHSGKFSFDTFTHQRASIDPPGFLDIALNKRFPPYTASNQRMLETLQWPRLPPRPGQTKGWFGFGAGGAKL